MGQFWDLLRKSRPLFSSESSQFEEIKKFVESKKDLKKIKSNLKLKKIAFGYTSLGTSGDVLFETDYPKLYENKLKDTDKEIKEFVKRINQEIDRNVKKLFFERFSKNAEKMIPTLIAPGITGMDHIKEAVAIQLFTTEKMHILLLGDPGTGKTDIIRSAAEMAPISSIGLGSGTSGVGLSMMVKGGKVIKGLLPQADNGLACIDELNLMKAEDMASLYSAMEKGFVSYDKADTHITLDARINVLATANPKGDKFAGWMLETIKKQIPFDSALMTRFHLVFLVKKPGVKEFENIARRIVSHHKNTSNSHDIAFVKEYVDYAQKFDVHVPDKIDSEIVKFVKSLKEKEDDFFVEVNPRIVHGILRMCKANARMNLRKEVSQDDFIKVRRIVEDCFTIKTH